MKKNLIHYLFLLFPVFASAQENQKITLGAYYFNGWSASKNIYLTKSLTDSFSERESRWGWVTSSQSVIDQQINTAADAGLGFFSFCWYTRIPNKPSSVNDALHFYLNSKYSSRLKFCLLVANHEGSEIGKKEWHDVTAEWLTYFRRKEYLTVDNKPLIIFFSLSSLLKNFKSPDLIKAAFDSLRKAARDLGLEGVSIAACINSEAQGKQALQCGFDLLTGYNYHEKGFVVKNQLKIPIDSMRSAEKRAWNKYIDLSVPFIPVATLNWDPRPWSNASNKYASEPYYTGFSDKSVYQSVSNLASWINDHPGNTTRERIGLLYAWNEYGEGAWLTPSKNDKLHLLDGIKKALR
jgi:hypothetical protein